jgi:hypothetical protein
MGTKKNRKSKEAAPAVVAVDDAELEALTRSLDDGEDIVITETAMDEIADHELEAIEGDLVASDLRSEAYDEQDGGADMLEASEVAPTGATVPATKRERAPRAKFVKQSEALFHKIGSAELALTTADVDVDQAAVRASIAEMIDRMPKKVQEKAVNIVTVAVAGGRLSTYTQIALKHLIDTGSLSSKDLVERYKTNDGKAYSLGTARAQAGQMMRLFSDLAIANKDGKSLTINPDSILAEGLKSAIATPAAA